MKNLGNKLRTARESKGLSLRDVADATRLRANILENMEAGEFSFDLPEIYKRGFLRLYATHLKLDAQPLLDEYSKNSMAREAKKAGVLFPETRKPILDGSDDVDSERFSSRRPDEAREEFSSTAPEPMDSESKVSYVKLGTIFVAVILSVVLLVFVVSSLMKSAAPEVNQDLQTEVSPALEQPVAAPQTPATPTSSDKFSVSATSDTYIVVWLENNPSRPLHAGPLQAGEKKTFSFSSSLMVRAIDAEKIKMEKNGTALNTQGKTGLHKFRISPSK